MNDTTVSILLMLHQRKHIYRKLLKTEWHAKNVLTQKKTVLSLTKAKIIKQILTNPF